MKNNTAIVAINPLDLLEAAAEELANGRFEWNHSSSFGQLVDKLVEGRLFRPDFTGEEDAVIWYQEIVADLLDRNWNKGCVGWRYYGVNPEVAKHYYNWAFSVAHGESRADAWFCYETDEEPVEVNFIE